MYNQTYEEYMRNVLGYMPSYQDMEYTYLSNPSRYYYPTTLETSASEMDEMYPEIYHKVYPMVKTACGNHHGEITKDTIEKITMEIFAKLGEIEIGAKVTVQNRNPENRTMVRQEENRNRSEDPRYHRTLKDLIKILVLRELFPSRRPTIPRPPYPPRPGVNPRPPFPGGARPYEGNLY